MSLLCECAAEDKLGDIFTYKIPCNIRINHIKLYLNHDEVKNTIALYADDCKSFRIIDSASDQNMFQEDLDNLHQWSLRNFMDFNVKKCKIMRITKKKQSFISNFLLHNSLLEEVSEFRDLGITTDQHLCWNLHIDKVVAKANRMLGLIKRTCRDFDDHIRL